jgi:hypothetical protein
MLKGIEGMSGKKGRIKDVSIDGTTVSPDGIVAVARAISRGDMADG